MSLELPAPISAYLAAKNAHDIDAMLAHFAADAMVHDEGEDHHGRDAIRDWIERATAKYAVTLEPVEVTPDSDSIIVRAKVSGHFPGSPIHLNYRFRLVGGRIAELDIA
jgi:ketosteroid isomerase-like protein